MKICMRWMLVTHKQCTLVSVAFLLSLLLFGSPGSPYTVIHAYQLVIVSFFLSLSLSLAYMHELAGS